MSKKIRLYSETSINLFQPINLPLKACHYLYSVMRKKKGDRIILFDNKNGDFLSVINQLSRSRAIVEPIEKTANYQVPEDIWVAFTPVKKMRNDFIIEKCTEIGIRKFQPIISEHSVTRKVRNEKWKLQSIEAAEQCGGNFLPEIGKLCTLENFFKIFPKDRKLIFCNELAAGPKISNVLGGESFSKACLLIGPEGGFSNREREMILSQKNVRALS